MLLLLVMSLLFFFLLCYNCCCCCCDGETSLFDVGAKKPNTTKKNGPLTVYRISSVSLISRTRLCSLSASAVDIIRMIAHWYCLDTIGNLICWTYVSCSIRRSIVCINSFWFQTATTNISLLDLNFQDARQNVWEAFVKSLSLFSNTIDDVFNNLFHLFQRL